MPDMLVSLVPPLAQVNSVPMAFVLFSSGVAVATIVAWLVGELMFRPRKAKS